MATKLTLRNHWLARYAAALGAVGAGFLLRLSLTALVGEGLPTYITFYPVIMTVALLGGFGPGLLATLLTALGVDYWILSPTHTFAIANLVDAVGLAFFSGMGVFMSVVAELYRRARQKATVHETEAVLREGGEAPSDWFRQGLLLNAGLVASLAILAAAGWQSVRNLRTVDEADRRQTHIYVVIEELDRLQSALESVESDQRGYLLTGMEKYLEPYRAALDRATTNMASLKRLTLDNPSQQRRLAQIESLTREMVTDLEETIKLRRTQGRQAASDVVAMDKGEVWMDRIRQRVADAQDEEARLLQYRTSAKSANAGKTQQVLLAGGILSLLLLTTVFLFLMQESSRRRRAEAELRRHRDDLQKVVTERTADLSHANESLRKSELQFRTLAESIPNLAWRANGDGYITWYNRRWYEYTGTTPDQMEGWGWQSVHDQRTLPAVLARWRACIAAGELFDMTFPLRGADGVFRPFLTRVMPLKDSQGRVQQWFGTNTDVSEQKRAEEAYARLAAIVESSDDAILSKDLSGTITSWNVGAERLFGYPAEEAIGRPIRLLLPPERQDEEDQIMARLQAGERVEHFETVRLTKAGLGLAVSVTSSPLKDGEGRIIGASKIIRDITERKRAEDAVAQLNAELHQRVAELQAANEEVQASRRAALSLAEDALEARKEVEQANADLLKANDSLDASRRAAFNLMDDAVRARKQVERASAELVKLNRTLKAHSKSDQALMRATAEAEFLEAVCRIVVEDCGHAMVWIGFAEEDEDRTVRPAAQAGFEAGYLETLKITWADTARGRGPTGTAIRTGQPGRCRNMLTDPGFAPWRTEAIQRGYASSLVLPLLAEGRAFGALTIYSKQPDGFSDDEVRLLTELADDLAYGITALRVRAAKEGAEAALLESEARLAGLVGSAMDAILSVDAEQRVVLFNAAAEKVFGCPASAALGQPLDRFIPESLRARHRQHIQEFSGTGVTSRTMGSLGDLTALRADGQAFPIEASISRADVRGQKLFTVILRDVTERKRAQAALQHTTEDLQRSNRDLEQFAYVASHDLQEPLRAVGGYVKLLQLRFPDKLDAKAQGYISGAFDGATRMEQLIRDLLAFSRVAMRGGPFVPADLEDALRQALRNLEASVNSSRATIAHDPLPSLAVDAGQIRQLFQNLIGNALKFHGEQPPNIHIGAQRQDGRWVFWVRDNSIGIEPQYYEKIFHIFQRLHTRKDYPGTGIGLAICKRIVERHGGTIWVESQPGQGSTFYFSLPDTPSKTAPEEPG